MAAAKAVDSARAFWIETEQVYRQIDAEAEPAMRDLRKLAVGLFGPDSSVVAALGVKAPRARPMTAEERRQARDRELAKGGG
jgi:DNA-binding IclR family transcriptional regulator